MNIVNVMLKKFQCTSNGPKSTNANFKVSGVFDIAFVAADVSVVDVVVTFVAAIIVVIVLCMVSVW